MRPTNLLSEYTNREITTTWYYVNSRRHVDSGKIRAPDGIWTHDPPWSSRMLYHWATGDSVVSKGQIVGIDWNRIAWLHSHVLVHMNSLTASRCHINASHMVEHPTRSRRVVGSNPIWGSDFFRVYVSPRIYVISCCCYFSVKFICTVKLYC